MSLKQFSNLETLVNDSDYKIELIKFDANNITDKIKADLNFKLIIIGDFDCGKDFIRKEINVDKINIIGFDFISFIVKINEKIVRLQIWDTCGEEGYRSLVKNFFGNTSLAILVYNINNYKTFLDIESHLKMVRTYNTNKNTRIFLIGNKVDLDKNREVTKEEGEQFTLEHYIDLFREISQKTNHNS